MEAATAGKGQRHFIGRIGGAPVARRVLRVTFWGAIAMAVTAGVGKILGAVISSARMKKGR